MLPWGKLLFTTVVVTWESSVLEIGRDFLNHAGVSDSDDAVLEGRLQRISI